MKLRAALTLALVVPSATVLVAPSGPAYAASVCQGRPATIEGSTGMLTGTDGDDVIVSTGADTTVAGLGGNDLICVVGGTVAAGLGDDAVVSNAAPGVLTTVGLVAGHDTYADVGAGRSDVIVDDITSFDVTLGAAGGIVELNPVETPGSGTVDFGPTPGLLYAFGLERSRVDLAKQTVHVDGLLAVTTVNLRHATATGCRVRMRGDDNDNVLDAYGRNIVVAGGDGRDRLSRIGNGFDLDLPRCGSYRSVFRGQGGPDSMSGRSGPDRLLGGPGRDRADGQGGPDVCRAEVKRQCER
jgi:hypothetical protein